MSRAHGYNGYARTGNFAVIGNFVTDVNSMEEAMLLHDDEAQPQPLTLPKECFIFAVEDFAHRHHSTLIHTFEDSCTISCSEAVFRLLRIEFARSHFSLAFIDAANLDYLVEAEEQWAANLPAVSPPRTVGLPLMYS